MTIREALDRKFVTRPWFLFTRRSNFLLLSTFLVTLIIVGALKFSNPPKPYVAVSALSEFVSFRVSRPTIAAIPLVNAVVRAANDHCEMPFTGVLEPASGAIVRYRFRSLTPRIAIQIEAGQGPSVTLRSDQTADCKLSGNVTVLMDQGGPIRALPIAGPTDIGAEFAAPAMPHGGPDEAVKFEQVRNIMWEGSVQAFTREYVSGALSPRADAEFTLPAGGRISSGDTLDPNQQGQDVVPWYGIAEITDRGFRVSATTTSLDLKLYRPGTNLGDAETFRLDFLANIFADPGVLRLAIIFAVVSYVMQIFATWMGFWRGPGNSLDDRE